MIRGYQHSSCPALCRASTPIFVEATKAWMACLHRSASEASKPGHDALETRALT